MCDVERSLYLSTPVIDLRWANVHHVLRCTRASAKTLSARVRTDVRTCMCRCTHVYVQMYTRVPVLKLRMRLEETFCGAISSIPCLLSPILVFLPVSQRMCVDSVNL